MIQCICIWTCIYIVYICLMIYEANSMEYDKHLDEGTIVLETCRRAWKDHSLPMVTLTRRDCAHQEMSPGRPKIMNICEKS